MYVDATPFVKGNRYRVRKSLIAPRSAFQEGQTVVFQYASYSIYDGCTGHFFRDSQNDEFLTWDICDSEKESLLQWQEYFELLTDEPTGGAQ